MKKASPWIVLTAIVLLPSAWAYVQYAKPAPSSSTGNTGPTTQAERCVRHFYNYEAKPQFEADTSPSVSSVAPHLSFRFGFEVRPLHIAHPSQQRTTQLRVEDQLGDTHDFILSHSRLGEVTHVFGPKLSNPLILSTIVQTVLRFPLVETAALGDRVNANWLENDGLQAGTWSSEGDSHLWHGKRFLSSFNPLQTVRILESSTQLLPSSIAGLWQVDGVRHYEYNQAQQSIRYRDHFRFAAVSAQTEARDCVYADIETAAAQLQLEAMDLAGLQRRLLETTQEQNSLASYDLPSHIRSAEDILRSTSTNWTDKEQRELSAHFQNMGRHLRQHPEKIPELVERLEKNLARPETRRAAAFMLDLLIDIDSEDSQKAVLTLMKGALQSDNEFLQRAIMLHNGIETPSRDNVDFIKETFLSARETEARSTALLALASSAGRLPSEQQGDYFELIVDRLEQPRDSEARATAISALGNFNGAAARSKLLSMLKPSEPQVREVIAALGRNGAPEAEHTLLDVVAGRDWSDEARLAALRSLSGRVITPQEEDRYRQSLTEAYVTHRESIQSADVGQTFLTTILQRGSFTNAEAQKKAGEGIFAALAERGGLRTWEQAVYKAFVSSYAGLSRTQEAAP